MIKVYYGNKPAGSRNGYYTAARFFNSLEILVAKKGRIKACVKSHQ